MALNFEALDAELEAIERRSKMIQTIKQLASDPEARALLERISQNGHVRGDSHNDDKSTRAEYAEFNQIGSIRHSIAKLHGGLFTVGDIGNQLRKAGMHVTNVAVGRALLRLSKNGEIKIAVQGARNVPRQV